MNIFHATVLAKFVAFMAALVFVNGELEGNKPSDLPSRRSSCSLVVVSTLDGKVSALDTKDNGKLLWTLPPFHGPLLSSSLSSIQMAKHVGLIPSLDGGLYQFNGDKVEPIPFTAESLLGSFYKLPDGSILVGGKEATSCGINPLSGTVRYVCSADGCHLAKPEESIINDDQVLVLKRIQQTIRAVDQRTGVERWNFSVGQHDISSLEAIFSDEDDSKCSSQDDEEFVDWNIRVCISSGLVAAVRSYGSKETEEVLWSHRFDAPIAAVWRLNGGYIEPVSILSQEVMPQLVDSSSQQALPQGPVMYIGKHEGQVYIQTSESFTPAQEKPAQFGVIGEKTTVQSTKSRQVTWRPYLTSSPSRTPTVVTKDLAVWNPLDYPFDNGYYLYGEVMPVIPPHTCKNDQKIVSEGQENVFAGDDKTTVAHTDRSSWRFGAMFVTVAFAVVLQFVICFFHRNKKNVRECDALMQLQRVPSKASTSSLETLMGLPSPSTGSSLTQTNSFSSRYLTDFEHECCLGKGGFGVVFQAKNKLDDCQYAIKMIRLPNCDEALEKVMREVKALAKLEHPSIVRYYNTWREAPPDGWQDEVYAKMYEEGSPWGISSDSPSNGSGIEFKAESTDNIIDRNDVQHNKSGRQRRKKTYSSSRSLQSSHSSIIVKDDSSVEEIENEESINIHQFENEAILAGHEMSDSFSVEFASSSHKGLTIKENGFNKDLIVEDCASNSIIFKDSDASHIQDEVDIKSHSTEEVESSSSKDKGFSDEMHFTSSHHSLLSREKHKCQNKNCSAEKLSAPLYVFIQMQLCKTESLKDWLKANFERNHVFCIRVFEQILDAVEYFHGRGLMHRDLKPSNIFFSLDGSVKVGDFGLVTAHSSENNIDISLKGTPMDDTNHTSQVGTQLYMSPEQIDGGVYSHKVDIFSLGLIFFELFCPFGTQMERIKVMGGVKQRVLPADFTEKMPLQSELVQWLLSASPKARPNATEVKNSYLLKQIRHAITPSNTDSIRSVTH